MTRSTIAAVVGVVGLALAADARIDTIASDGSRFVSRWVPGPTRPDGRLARQASAFLTLGDLREAYPEEGRLLVAPPTGAVGVRIVAAAYQELKARPWLGEDAWPDDGPVAIEEVGWLRGVRIVRVRVRPWSLSPDRARLKVLSALEFEVVFEAGPRGERQRDISGSTPTQPVGPLASDPFAQAVAAVTANAGVAADAGWLGALATPAAGRELGGAGAAIWEPGAGSLRIEVDLDGVHRLDRASLEAAGFDLTGLEPQDLALFADGLAVPLEVEGASDGRIDAIVFWGERSSSRLSDVHVYWLLRAGGGRSIREIAEWQEGDGRLESVSIVTETLRLERQTLPWARMPHGDEGRDFWFSGRLDSQQGSLASCVVEPTMCLDLPGPGESFDLARLAPAESGRSYAVRGRVAALVTGATADAQLIDVSVNALSIGRASWSAGLDPEEFFSLPYSPAMLARTGNTLRLMQPPPSAPLFGWRVVYVDALELEYPAYLAARDGTAYFSDARSARSMYAVGGLTSRRPRVYVKHAGGVDRITRFVTSSPGPGMPFTMNFPYGPALAGEVAYAVIQEERLLAPRAVTLHAAWGLADSARAADYMVIAHRAFLEGAETLAAYRESAAGGSLSPTVVVDLQAVYDTFAYGNESSQAINDFLAYAYRNWRQAPRYVTLVGDTTDDYRNHRGLSAPGYEIPSYLPAREVYLDSVRDLRAISDSWFGCVDGDDWLPDILIGRVPVRQLEAVERYVTKLETYEAVSPPGFERVELIADDDIANDGSQCGIPGEAAEFFDAAIEELLPDGNPDNLLRRYGGSYVAPAPGFRWQSDIYDDMDSGVGVQVFLGHGTTTDMGRHCTDPGRFILALDTLDYLVAGSVVPLGVTATCSAGQFDLVSQRGDDVILESLAEHYLATPDKGFLAAIATSSILLYTDGESLTHGVLRGLYGADEPPIGPEGRIVGAVAASTLLHHLERAGSGARDGLLTTVVLGDPATRLPIRRP